MITSIREKKNRFLFKTSLLKKDRNFMFLNLKHPKQKGPRLQIKNKNKMNNIIFKIKKQLKDI